MTEPLDLLLPAALERWWKASRSLLAARGVTATLQGPFDAPGMDPVYILRMDSEHRETEVCLFRGGTILINCFDKHQAAKADSGSAGVSSEMTSSAYSSASPNTYSKNARPQQMS